MFLVLEVMREEKLKSHVSDGLCAAINLCSHTAFERAREITMEPAYRSAKPILGQGQTPGSCTEPGRGNEAFDF
jgi:hypothetical protein